jgi:hypothetical protein
MLPADVSNGAGFKDAEAFLFFDGFISAIFLDRHITIYDVMHDEKKTKE